MFCTSVEPILKEHPFCELNLVFEDRSSLKRGLSNTYRYTVDIMKSGDFFKKYGIISISQDHFHYGKNICILFSTQNMFQE